MTLLPRTLKWRLLLTLTATLLFSNVILFVPTRSHFNEMLRDERLAMFAQQCIWLQGQGQSMTFPFSQRDERSGIVFEAHVDAAAAGEPDRMNLPADPKVSDDGNTLTLPNIFIRYSAGNDGSTRPHPGYRVEARIGLQDQRVVKASMTVEPSPPKSPIPLPTPLLADLGLRLLLATLVSLFITSWLVKPLSALAASADSIGRGDYMRKIEVSGPSEVATTLAAVERMRIRVVDMIQQRTGMLVALAHDISAPVTRLILKLELSADAGLKADAINDCNQMKDLVASTLEYVRSVDENRALMRVPIDVAIREVVSTQLSLPAGSQVSLILPALAVQGNEWAIKRVVVNLVENAIKYGRSPRIEASEHGVVVRVVVRDFGGGVPEYALAHLGQPFYRIDPARTPGIAGIGLGISIVRNLMRSMGGELVLKNHPDGGLEATLIFKKWVGE